MEELKAEIKIIADNLLEDMEKFKTNGIGENELNSIFRHIHTIKGGVASVGLKNFATFLHKTENLVDYYRKKTDKDVFDLMKESLEKCIVISKYMSESSENYSSLDNEIKEKVKGLELEIDFISKIKKIGEEKFEISDRNEEIEILETDSIVYKIDIIFDKAADMKLVKCFMVETNLTQLGNIIASNIEDFKNNEEKDDLTITFQTFKRVSKEMVSEIADVGEIKSLKIIPLDSLINFYVNKFNELEEFRVVYVGKNKDNIEKVRKNGFEVDETESLFADRIINRNIFLIIEVTDATIDEILKNIRKELPFTSYIVILEKYDSICLGKALYYNCEAVYIKELSNQNIYEEIINGISRTKRLMRH